MKRVYSVSNVLNARFRTMEFDGVWKDAIGCPELTGSWLIFGPPKHGKTSFAMMLAKYLTRFGRVFYNSVEEGLSRSIQMAYRRAGMEEVAGRIDLGEESIELMIKRLKRRKSAGIVFIDSVQFADMRFADYKDLKAALPRKLFIYLSHIRGVQPDGATAVKIWKDSNVAFKVEGFRAFPTGRYGGEGYIDVSERRAMEYWIK